MNNKDAHTQRERDIKEDVGEAVAWQRQRGADRSGGPKSCHSHESAAGLDLEARAKCQGLFSPGMSH